ncbi:hypothetical protein [Corynebacterium crudilactis]|uniref:Uncharacterized protein n=1 Tax=Corynebacterium crudilactis TaxID=1652495 RepID=A0A172QXP7_9CORY|nr:hypothetical protein [Corynebacterium crudilactis]ANE05483.1 hypothetical protein ccrud_14170 [Corynebacterium crudilactis]
MRIVDSQDSRTHLPLARFEEKTAMTWGFSCQITQSESNQDVICNTTKKCSPRIIETLEPAQGFSGMSFESALGTCPQEALRRFSRLRTLDGILCRLRTEKGQDTFSKKFRGLPQGLTTEQELEWALREAEADHDAESAFTAWAHALDRTFNLRRDGRAKSFILPAPESGLRWQSRKLWIEGALADPQVTTAPAMKRMAKKHLPILLHAISDFADGVTGCGVAASHATIARRARQIAVERPEIDPGGRGKPLHQMTADSIEKNVRTLRAVLRNTGWAVDCAGGRHLTTVERCLAKILFGINQTKVASVQDLVTPERAWVREEPRDARPNWATSSNAFTLRLAARSLWKTARKIMFSSTYPARAQVSFIFKIFIGLLKKIKSFEIQKSAPKRRKTNRFAGVPDPSRESQKITADLRQSWGWLLPKTRSGQRMDPRVVARIIDEEGGSHLTAKKIKTFVDLRLSMNFWEFSPARIKNRLAWFRTILRDLLGTRGEDLL